MLSDAAPAKVNLSLHVMGRRADGYHLLESLVVFADAADQLTFQPGDELSIAVTGPRALAAGPDADNLVLKAAKALAARRSGVKLGHFTLEKHLPAAAGLGGGSSDAAAALRLIARANKIALDDPDIAAAALVTGADVPVCLDPRPSMMRGIGEELVRLGAFPKLPGLLVNPGKPAETRAVFARLGLTPGTMKAGDAHPLLAAGIDRPALLALLDGLRNDLEAAAIAVEPVIGTVIAALRRTSARLVRMSGSGATVFALYDTDRQAVEAADNLSAAHPDWWVRPVMLG